MPAAYELEAQNRLRNLTERSHDLGQHCRCTSGVTGAEKLLIHEMKGEESNKYGHRNSHAVKHDP
jgi:hypothetical protein